MKTPVKAIIADDMQLFLEALAVLLEKHGVAVTGKAKNGEELVAMVHERAPDIIITDIEMPVMGGVEATRILTVSNPAIGIIGLTMYEDEQLVVDMLEAGAKGYLNKDSCADELYDAITTVKEGKYYLPEDTPLRLTRMIAASKANLLQHLPGVVFSDKEKEIIQLICQQYSSKQIADMMMIAQATVDKYRTQIMSKISAKNVVGIVLYAIENKLN